MTGSDKKEKVSGSKLATERTQMRFADLWDIFGDTINNYRENGDVNQAAAIALYAILSVIPLFILSLIAANQFASTHPDIQAQIIEGIQQFHPYFSGDLLTQLGRIDTKKQVLGWVGIISLIWLSSAIFSSMETALNLIFRSQARRNYFVSKLLAIAMIPLGWAIGIASIAITYIATLIAENPFFVLEDIFLFNLARSAIFRYLLPYLLMVVFFTVVYKVIPTKKISIGNAIVGSAIFSALMEVAKQLFTWYISNYTRYNVIFGSLETVVILVIWVFYMSLILLFCAELVSSYQRRDLILLERALLNPKKVILKVDERLFHKFGRIYQEGEYIFREGDTNREMYYILAGQIRLEKRAGQVKKILARLGPGMYFGEMAALIDAPRTASAHVEALSSIAVVDGDTVRSLLRGSEEVSLFMLKEFSKRIINTNESLEVITQAFMKLMVIFYFLKEWPLRDDRIPLNELAQFTGKSQAEILEVLIELGKDGVLTMEGDRITGFSREFAFDLSSEQALI